MILLLSLLCVTVEKNRDDTDGISLSKKNSSSTDLQGEREANTVKLG